MPKTMTLQGPRLGKPLTVKNFIEAYNSLDGDLIPGGRAAGRSPWMFDRRQLAIGTRVEMEHTNDRRVAREIAMDHLVEDPFYYQKLATIHLDGLDFGGSKLGLFAAGLVGLLAGAWLGGRR